MKWFEAYLTGRSMSVNLEGSFSSFSTLGTIFQEHAVAHHCYTDDTQLYLSVKPDISASLKKLKGCLDD